MQNLKLDEKEVQLTIESMKNLIQCVEYDIKRMESDNLFEKLMAFNRSKIVSKSVDFLFKIHYLGIRTGLAFLEIQKTQTSPEMEKWINKGVKQHPIFIQEDRSHCNEKEIVIENELELAEALQKIYREISSHMEQNRKENEKPEVTH